MSRSGAPNATPCPALRYWNVSASPGEVAIRRAQAAGLTLAQVRGLVLALPDFRDEPAGGTDPVRFRVPLTAYRREAQTGGRK